MRIAIVNDTLMAVEVMKRIISFIPEYQLAWVANDGQEAVTRAAQDTPDLILMDLIMPVMDGVEATRRIMANSPCAILVVTSTVEGNSDNVFQAMGYGALDAVNTPVVLKDAHVANNSLLYKIGLIGKLLNKANRDTEPSVTDASDRQQASQAAQPLLVIGASSGGPSALVKVLAELPVDFPASIIIVQHVDQQFVQGLADWINAQIDLPLRLAQTGDTPRAGEVLLSDSGQHLQLNRHGVLQYSDEPAHYPYRPSVNVLFDSVASNWHGEAIGVLMTGMGRDGASGLLKMRNRGFLTIAQDEASCTVYGMPKAAVELGAAKEIMPLAAIAPKIRHYFARFSPATRAIKNE